MTDENNEITLESVDDFDSENLTDDQTTFLTDNADDLTDDQKETYKEVLEEKEDEDVDPTKVKVKVRTKTEKPKETEEGDDEEDDDVDEEDQKAIDKRVDKRVKPLQDKLDAAEVRSQKIADEAEVDAYIRDNPDFKKYRGVILKYMKNSSHSNLPASSIAAIVSAEDQQAIGAKRERTASKKADDTKSSGSSARKTKPGEIDWGKAKPEQMAAKKQEILDRSRE